MKLYLNYVDLSEEDIKLFKIKTIEDGMKTKEKIEQLIKKYLEDTNENN